MLMSEFDREKYDWKTRDDADALIRFQQIKADPERLKKAQDCIQDSLSTLNQSLGIPAPEVVPGRKNPATIRRLSPDDIR